ncbi:MAG: hypothetical protein ACK50P_12920, partial [Planctomycetaceae bacterium]
AGYLLLDDGRCPDGDGAKASESLKSSSAPILEAVGKREACKKEASAAKEAFKKLTTDGCAAGDKVHTTWFETVSRETCKAPRNASGSGTVQPWSPPHRRPRSSRDRQSAFGHRDGIPCGVEMVPFK